MNWFIVRWIVENVLAVILTQKLTSEYPYLQENIILMNQFGWYKILMANIQCVLSQYCTSFHETIYKGTNTCALYSRHFTHLCVSAFSPVQKKDRKCCFETRISPVICCNAHFSCALAISFHFFVFFTFSFYIFHIYGLYLFSVWCTIFVLFLCIIFVVAE